MRNRLTAGAQLLNDPRHLHRIPDHRRVREQTQTRRLVHDLFVIAGLKRPLIGEKETTGDLVPSLAPVELQLHPRPEALLLDVAEERETAECSAQGSEGLGQTIRRGTTGQAPQDHMGGGRPVAQGGDDAHQLILLFPDELRIDSARDDVIERTVGLRPVQLVELSLSRLNH